jgi:tetratricopeptide (TPR) repeat protein
MTRKPTRRRGAASLALLVYLAAAIAAIAALQAANDQIIREKIPGSSIIYLPSGKYLKAATLGYAPLAADLIYLWAIQYYSDMAIEDRFTYLERIFSIIAELDPRWTDPYEVGALLANAEAGDPKLALKILDLGAEKNPAAWIFPFEAGHIAQMTLKDFALAEIYYAKCMTLPGAPPFVSRLRANAIYRKGDLKSAWETWLEIHDSAPDEETRKIASNHLYRVKATADLGALSGALDAYRAKTGRLPASLGDLVRAGLLPALPRDLDGKDYVYDPESGLVKAPTSPWKR